MALATALRRCEAARRFVWLPKLCRDLEDEAGWGGPVWLGIYFPQNKATLWISENICLLVRGIFISHSVQTIF